MRKSAATSRRLIATVIDGGAIAWSQATLDYHYSGLKRHYSSKSRKYYNFIIPGMTMSIRPTCLRYWLICSVTSVVKMDVLKIVQKAGL